jgi:hypothetical protein
VPTPEQVAERDRRQLLALLFGVSDMWSVALTADYLNDIPPFELDERIRRAIEAGVIVVYSRPFLESRGLPRLAPASGLGEHLRSIHDQIVQERHRDYAHTDENAYRMVIELEEPEWLERFIETGVEELRETWKPPTLDELEDLRALAEANRETFMVRIEKLRRYLRYKGEG